MNFDCVCVFFCRCLPLEVVYEVGVQLEFQSENVMRRAQRVLRYSCKCLRYSNLAELALKSNLKWKKTELRREVICGTKAKMARSFCQSLIYGSRGFVSSTRVVLSRKNYYQQRNYRYESLCRNKIDSDGESEIHLP